MYALVLWHLPPSTASSQTLYSALDPNLRPENTLEVKAEQTIVVYAGFNHQQLEVAGPI